MSVKEFDLYILIGRSKLKLLYSQNKKDLRSFNYENSSYTPFYFYSDNNSSAVGEKAKIKFENKHKDAFYNYFDLIKQASNTFIFFGDKQNVKLIIVRAVEKLIDEFLNEIIFSSESVYQIKDKIDLKLVYYSDVNENEINLVNNLFENEAYSSISAFNYNYLLLNFLDLKRKIGSYKGYITSDAIDDDLHLSYYDSLKRNNYKTKDIGKKIAINPMINIIGERIVGKAIGNVHHLNKEDELAKHKPLFVSVAEKLKSKREFWQEIKLSNGITENVKIKLSQINSTLMTQSHFTKDFGFIQQFHQKTGLQQSDAIFILHGVIQSTQYADKIKSNFAHVYISEEPSTEIFQLFYENSECANNGDLTSAQSLKISSQKNKDDSKNEDAKLKIVENKILQENPSQVKTITKTPERLNSPVEKVNSEKTPISGIGKIAPPPPPLRGGGNTSPPSVPAKGPVTPRIAVKVVSKKPKAPRKPLPPPPMNTINRVKPVKKIITSQPQKRATPKSVAPPNIVADNLKNTPKRKKTIGKRPPLPPLFKKN